MEKYYLSVLQNIMDIAGEPLKKLLAVFGSGENIWLAGEKELAFAHVLRENQLERFIAYRNSNKNLPHQVATICEKKHIFLCSIDDDDYPALLREIDTPPYVLFYRGRLGNDLPRIAMVGSRKISPYGRAAAERFSVALASCGFAVVSGGAYGVDTESHKGALSVGITEAVMGCGVDIAYPPTNANLLAEISETGAVISEYLPGTPPLKHNFPARNRIISGMSLGTLVVEAAERSGSLITAVCALEAGRDVFAVPASIFASGSRGSNKLIQQGAKLVLDSEDIISEYRDKIKLKTLSKKNGKMEKDFVLSKDEEKIFSLLTPDEPMSVDDILYQLTEATPARVSYHLLQMELRGLVQSDGAHRYVRK